MELVPTDYNTAYYMHLSERGSEGAGMSLIKLVGYWFPLLQIHIYFGDVMNIQSH